MILAIFLAAGLAWWLHREGALLPNLKRLAILGGQMLRAELAQGLEQPKPPFFPVPYLSVLDDEQGPLSKLRQELQRQRLLADRLSRLRRAASEDGEAREEASQVRRQQVMAPFQGRPERPMPRPFVPAPAGQQGESLRQALVHLRGRQSHRPRRHQFDSQGDTFQVLAQRGYGGGVARRELEVGPDRLGTVHEELRAGRPRDERSRAVRIRQGKGRDRELALAGQGQPAARGD